MKEEVKLILKKLEVTGEELLCNTPKRVENAFKEILHGGDVAPPAVRWFPYTGSSVLLTFGPIEAVSMCPHHLLPVSLTGYFGYKPTVKVLGISKPSRLLKWAAARLILQEEVASLFFSELFREHSPLGGILLLKGTHACLSLRGAQQKGQEVTSLTATGVFEEEVRLREEFFRLISQ